MDIPVDGAIWLVAGGGRHGMFKLAVAMITGTIATRLLPDGDDWLAHAA
jgi:hypothetical protein